MCQLLGMNSSKPAALDFSFAGFAERGGRTGEHSIIERRTGEDGRKQLEVGDGRQGDTPRTFLLLCGRLNLDERLVARCQGSTAGLWPTPGSDKRK